MADPVTWIPEETFATCLRNLPVPCIDLVVCHEGGLVLARRTNDPAGGEWFWPGGRVYKHEGLEAAVHRVADAELGLSVTALDQLGASEHHWSTAAVPGVDSHHTITIVYRVEPEGPLDVTLDDQHDEWRLLREREADLHEYVEAYLDRWDLLAAED